MQAPDAWPASHLPRCFGARGGRRLPHNDFELKIMILMEKVVVLGATPSRELLCNGVSSVMDSWVKKGKAPTEAC